MGYKVKGLIVVCAFLALLAFASAVAALPSMRLDFYKDNGYGMGGDIQGQWTINAVVSSDVVRVEFYLDNQMQNNATAAPFSWSFNTGNYSEGQHTFKVVAYDSAGVTAEVEKQNNFVGFPVSFVVGIIGVIVATVVVVLVISVYRIKKYPARKNQH